jgi:nucleoside-diphosphate-sugar epimerase
MDEQILFAIHVDGARNMLSACQESKTVVQMIYISSTSAIHRWGDVTPMDENIEYPSAFVDMYSFAKASAEVIVCAENGVGGVLTAVARFPMIYGPNSLVTSLWRKYRSFLCTLTHRKAHFMPIYVDNAAYFIHSIHERLFADDERVLNVAGQVSSVQTFHHPVYHWYFPRAQKDDMCAQCEGVHWDR